MYKKDQNEIILNFKIMKYLKTMGYIVGHNPRNWYNYNPIILFNWNFSINFIIILLIAIKFSNGNTCVKLTAINEKLYDILVYMYSSDRLAQHKIWWDDIEVCYTKYTRTLLKDSIYDVVSDSPYRNFQIFRTFAIKQNYLFIYMYLICFTVFFSLDHVFCYVYY